MNKKIKYLLHLLGPAILVYILFQIDFNLLGQELRSINVWWLLIAAAVLAIQIIFRALKWRAILLGLKIRISVATAATLYWLGTFVGVITPGRLGEVIKVFFLNNRKHSPAKSLLSVILDRLTDIIALLGFGLIIFLFFLPEAGLYISIFGIVAAALVILLIMMVNEKSFVSKIFSAVLKKMFAIKMADYQPMGLRSIIAEIKEFKKSTIGSFLFYLVASWMLYFSARYLVIVSLGIDIGFLEIAIISVLVAIISVLPISVAGLGTREATVIYFFSIYGISAEAAVAYSLLVFAIDMIVLSFGIIPYFKESASISKIKK